MKCVVAILLCLLLAIPGYGWNATGHKAIALIAYNQLTPATRDRVDQLLAQHPDYPKWIGDVPPAGRGRAAFLAASLWPDTIRNDPRFHDDNRTPTADIPGLPAGSQARHANWHYMNLPFSTDSTPTRPSEEPNILTKLQDLERLDSMPDISLHQGPVPQYNGRIVHSDLHDGRTCVEGYTAVTAIVRARTPSEANLLGGLALVHKKGADT